VINVVVVDLGGVVSGFDERAGLGEFNTVELVDGLLGLLDHQLDETSLVACRAKAFEPDTDVLHALAQFGITGDG
jgi:hypothetical protein